MYYVPLFREVLYIRYGTPCPVSYTHLARVNGKYQKEIQADTGL